MTSYPYVLRRAKEVREALKDIAVKEGLVKA